MQDQKLTSLIALIVVVGTLGLALLEAFVKIPDNNAKTLDAIITAWLTVGLAVVLKRLFDGNRSSDIKNGTIAAQASALSAATAAPPAAVTAAEGAVIPVEGEVTVGGAAS